MVEGQRKDENLDDIEDEWPDNDEEIPYDEGSEPDSWKKSYPDDIETDEKLAHHASRYPPV